MKHYKIFIFGDGSLTHWLFGNQSIYVNQSAEIFTKFKMVSDPKDADAIILASKKVLCPVDAKVLQKRNRMFDPSNFSGAMRYTYFSLTMTSLMQRYTEKPFICIGGAISLFASQAGVIYFPHALGKRTAVINEYELYAGDLSGLPFMVKQITSAQMVLSYESEFRKSEGPPYYNLLAFNKTIPKGVLNYAGEVKNLNEIGRIYPEWLVVHGRNEERLFFINGIPVEEDDEATCVLFHETARFIENESITPEIKSAIKNSRGEARSAEISTESLYL